jgi:hypothetical protein
MQFLATYWWLLALPIFLIFWILSIRRTSRSQWVWILRIIGVALLATVATWLITGDIDRPYVSIHLSGGWPSAALFAVLGLAALLGAQRLAAKRGPPA